MWDFPTIGILSNQEEEWLHLYGDICYMVFHNEFWKNIDKFIKSWCVLLYHNGNS